MEESHTRTLEGMHKRLLLSDDDRTVESPIYFYFFLDLGYWARPSSLM